MSLALDLATTLLFALAPMLPLWLLSLARRDASLVDLWWGPGIAWIAFATARVFPDGDPARRELAFGLAAVWGLRLGIHLLWRSRGRGEDFRYRALRARAGGRFWWQSLFSVFLLQGVLQWAVSLPVQLALLRPSGGLGALDALGALLFAVGFAFETVADRQLARFRADPANAGRVLDSGLWRLSRHPNYFGDCLAWWGLGAIGLSVPGGALGLAGPLLLTFLLLRVSGVPLLEGHLAERRPGYADYVRRTSAFLPRPPRRA
jgi:steroid 5-alpha reductase family enzyme